MSEHSSCIEVQRYLAGADRFIADPDVPRLVRFHSVLLSVVAVEQFVGCDMVHADRVFVPMQFGDEVVEGVFEGIELVQQFVVADFVFRQGKDEVFDGGSPEFLDADLGPEELFDLLDLLSLESDESSRTLEGDDEKFVGSETEVHETQTIDFVMGLFDVLPVLLQEELAQLSSEFL